MYLEDIMEIYFLIVLKNIIMMIKDGKILDFCYNKELFLV